MNYAIVPHAGDWREAAVFRDGWELNYPLLVRKVLPHAGSLPTRFGFVEVSHPSVVLSAVKPVIGGDIALRVYEATGQATQSARVRLHANVLSSREANLLEEPGRELKVENDSVSFDLHPFEIKTIRFRVGKR